MNCYVLSEEPSGPTYDALIDFCCSTAARMMFVVQDPHPSIEQKLDCFRPDFINEERVREWPGTILHGGEATAYWHAVTPRLQQSLKAQATRLFEWVEYMPEDPCFFRVNGQVLLVTTSHERDAYLMLTDEERMIIQQTFPALAAILREEGEMQ
jgi:hypothetical protein